MRIFLKIYNSPSLHSKPDHLLIDSDLDEDQDREELLKLFNSRIQDGLIDFDNLEEELIDDDDDDEDDSV
jgi:hypothetical protein